MFWSATRILGPEDKDTIMLLKKFSALSRLNKRQQQRLKKLLRRILERDPSSGSLGFRLDIDAMEALHGSEAYNSV